MKRRFGRRVGLCALCASLPAFLEPSFVLAQNASDDEVITLPTVEVLASPLTDTSAGPVDGYRALTGNTATKTDTPLKEIPQSIQVIPRSVIDDQQDQTLQEALENVSGVRSPDRQERLTTTFFVRGFQADQFIDGSPVFGQTAVFDSGTLINVERIEVLKGPSATLFGGGTGAPVGGIINVVPKSPEFESGYTAGVRAGSFATANPFWDFNQPLVEDRLALRFTGDLKTSESHVDNERSKRVALFPSLRAVLSEDTELMLRGFYTREKYKEYSGLPAEGAIGDAFSVDRFRFSGASDVPSTRVENGLFIGRLTHQFNDHLTGWVQGSYYDSFFEENSSFLLGDAPNPAQPSVFNVFSGELETDVEQINVNPNLSAKFSLGWTDHTFLIGAEYDRTKNPAFLDFRFNGQLDYADPDSDRNFLAPNGTGLSRQNNVYDTLGIYAQEQVTLFERLHLLGGLRWSRIDVEEKTRGEQESGSRITPRVGAAFDINDQITAFVGYGEGFQAVLNFVGDGPPEPEESEQIEAGFKFAFNDIGLSGSIAGYEITRRNVPITDPDNITRQIQTGEQRSRGAELDLIWQPTAELSFLANYAYTDAEITEDSTFSVGDRLPRIPLHSGRIAARYEFLEGTLDGLGVGLGLTAASEREISLPNSFQTESYFTIDAQLSYELGPVKFGLSVLNLTDEHYYEPYLFLNQRVVRPAQSRAVYATVSATF